MLISGLLQSERLHLAKDRTVFMRPILAPPEPDRVRPCAGNECCDDTGCVSLKKRRLCREWYFLRWMALPFIVPPDMLCELRKQLDKRAFRYCATMNSAGLFEILLRVDRNEMMVWTRNLVPTTDAMGLDPRQSRAWHLKCC